MRVRLGVPLAVACGMLSVGAGGASAALADCPPRDERPCERLTVPLDRSGVLPGSVRLHVERYRARRPKRPPVVVLVGAPGQSLASALEPPSFGIGWDALEMLVGEERRSRDVVLVDLRGSGRSGPLSCPELQRPHRAGAVARCATRLGLPGARYTAVDMADDIEDLRAAIGAPQIALLGASYGTHVALTYAWRHPARVERMVLDSPVAPEGVDPFRRSALNAAPRRMDVLCGSFECASFTRDAGADLRRVATRLERQPLRGQMTLPSGRRVVASLDGPGLVALVLASDVDPLLAATLPAAVRRAAEGDPSLLLRAAWAARRNGAVKRPVPATASSEASRLAALCSGASMPWSVTTPPAERLLVATSFAEHRGPGAFAPFGARAAASGELLRSCAEWPASGRSISAPPPLPDVPALIVSGTADLQAPTEDARALAAQLPRARLAVIANAGHGVLDYGFPCPTRTVERFLAGQAVEPCPDEPRGNDVLLPPPPETFDALRTRGMPPRVGRTVSAVLWTAFDLATAFSQRALPVLERSGESGRGLRMRLGALRGGSYVLGPKGIHIRRAQAVPGVIVSGHVGVRRVRAGQRVEIHFRGRQRRIRRVPVWDDRVRVRLRVRGREAARGWLELRRARVLVGRLDGRRVRYTPDWREMHDAVEYWSPSLFRDRLPEAGPTARATRD